MQKLPPLIELRAFDAAARHLSFKKAAAELGVTPTAISHQIRLLERYCGRALFRRRPRPLSLTEAGARLFPAIRGGLEGFAAAIAAVKRDGDQQPLRVTTTNAFASRWLVPRLPAWRKLHPDAPLEVIGTDSVLDLHAGDGDVAIRYATSRARADGRDRRGSPQRHVLARLQSALAFNRAPEATCRPRKARSRSTAIGRRPIASRPPGRDGLPRPSASGAKCPSSRTCST